MIKLKRLVVGSDTRPKIEIYIDGQLKHTWSASVTYTSDTINAIKFDPYEIGPVEKTQPYIEIKIADYFNLKEEEAKFTIKGKIYDLWKNGYKVNDEHNFIDVDFAWRDKPKSANKKKPKTR